MENLQINIKINESLYLKDPESTVLGKKIISKSIELIVELGFESFTFKKLGTAIGSPESSVYRYFESKHKLLVYLICWYWSWIEYKIVFATVNQPSSRQKLKSALEILTTPIRIDDSFAHINEVLLNKIVIAESTKVFHTKAIVEENQQGHYAVYKRIVQRVAEMILEVKPSYKYPQMLVSTIISGVNEQNYFAEFLPSITDTDKGKDRVANFYEELVLKLLSS